MLVHLGLHQPVVAVLVRVGLEGGAAREHLVDGDAQGIDVRPGVHVFGAADLLGRHVGRRAQRGAGARAALSSHDLGHAEVHHLDLAPWFHKHVGGLEVPVHHPLFVGVGHRAEDLANHRHGPLQGDGANLPADDPGEGAPRHELHDHGQGVHGEVLQLDDVGVLQSQLDARLIGEALDQHLVLGQQGVHHLDRHHGVQQGVAAPPDAAHAALAQALLQAVSQDLGPCEVGGHLSLSPHCSAKK